MTAIRPETLRRIEDALSAMPQSTAPAWALDAAAESEIESARRAPVEAEAGHVLRAIAYLVRRLELDAPRPESTSPVAAQDGSSVDQSVPGPLDDVLAEASKRVACWPDWKRSDDVKRRFRELDERAKCVGAAPRAECGCAVASDAPSWGACGVAADDGRWLAGARWACRDRLFVLERTSSFQGLAWAHFVSTSMAFELGEMTEANGWRFIGRPEEPAR